MIKKRLIYGIIAFLLLLSEVYIALFVSDNFIRPYFGDVLVTALICSFIRIFFPLDVNYSMKRKSVWIMPIAVFIFSVCIEIAQYFHYVDLLGLGHIEFFRIVMGTGFAWEDILCYACGCFSFLLIEVFFRRKKKEKLKAEN